MSLRRFAARPGAIFAILIAIAVCSPVHAKPVAAKPKKPAASPKASTAQEIAKHLELGKNYWEDNKTEEAVAEWRTVLKLDPSNQEAKDYLEQAGEGPVQPIAPPPPSYTPPKVDPAVRKAELMAGAKDALTRYAKAETMAQLADVLDDESADTVARDILIMYRGGIQAFHSGTGALDPSIYDDYERFIDDNGLAPIIQAKEAGQVAGYSTSRLHGRAFLQQMTLWIPRLDKVRLYLIYGHPSGWAHAADHVEQDILTETVRGGILLDGPALDDGAPIQMQFEDGKWRIGTRAGLKLNFSLQLQNGGKNPRK